MVGKGQELSIDVTDASDFDQHSKTMVGKKRKTFYFTKGTAWVT
jgi:hypothetical protein